MHAPGRHLGTKESKVAAKIVMQEKSARFGLKLTGHFHVNVDQQCPVNFSSIGAYFYVDHLAASFEQRNPRWPKNGHA